MKPGEELKDGPPIHATPAGGLLDGDAGGPVAGAHRLLVVSSTTTRRSRAGRSGGVTAQQFAWSFQYPPSVTGGAPVESHQLYLPRAVGELPAALGRTSSTRSGSPPFASRRTWCRHHRPLPAPRPIGWQLPDRGATCSAGLGTRCMRTSVHSSPLPSSRRGSRTPGPTASRPAGKHLRHWQTRAHRRTGCGRRREGFAIMCAMCVWGSR